MKSIIAKGIGEYTYSEHLYDYKISNVEEIVLHDAKVLSQALFDFLGMFRNLRIFEYEHSDFCKPSDWYGPPSHDYGAFDPSQIRNALVGHNRDTLTRLRVCANNEEKRIMGTLRNLDALSTLEVDWSLLVPADSRAQDALVNALPRSIEQLNFHMDDHKYDRSQYNSIACTVAHLIMRRKINFPGLQDIRLSRMTEGWAAKMKDALAPRAQSQHVNLHFDTV